MKTLITIIAIMSTSLSFAVESCFELVGDNTRNIEVSAPEEICLRDLSIDGAWLRGDISINGSRYNEFSKVFTSEGFVINSTLIKKRYSAGSCEGSESLTIKIVSISDTDGIIDTVSGLVAQATYTSDECHGSKPNSSKLRYVQK